MSTFEPDAMARLAHWETAILATFVAGATARLRHWERSGGYIIATFARRALGAGGRKKKREHSSLIILPKAIYRLFLLEILR